MQNESEVIIRFADQFERELYILSKRYRRIRADIEPIIQGLQAGNFIGDRIAGLGAENQVLKVQVKNSDIQKGKSGGYRLIFVLLSLPRVFCY
ncbi:type II toxin-antitoxin system RelE/ParE family toxin [Ancylothrix sp. D3o]|uniref:type II toxin-antitoxin system RelE/ParE family toxin n=1 Tax=Ancylothrix sp. D3o TaxID=2953691 RepID=UPI00294FF64E|nr:type II toxin-antitoxin system RelE/ParE family toxin [Ancylothrix sp. D3o]